MKTSTVKGTKDFLPNEVALRDYMQNKILEVYQNNGFSRISTPILEDIENLNKSEGGENLNLIFQVLKRGEKLASAIQDQKYNELCDMGLRYDLTLPLCRYYANNKGKLMLPLKCIQIDKVYRAERPQRGRDREFIQCDIDILGSDSITCEIELIYTTSKALMSVGIDEFTIKVNDRRLLKDLLLAVGVKEKDLDSVCISIDKLDKIGIDGLKEELSEKRLGDEVVTQLIEILSVDMNLDRMKRFISDKRIVEELQQIISAVTEISDGSIDIKFDLTLVRGQGYYTGTIFEIESKKFGTSIGGGGRYDNLIAKFIGEQVPAVGFSIGFERIYALLSKSGFKIPEEKKKIAVFYEIEDFVSAYKNAEQYRQDYKVSLYKMPKKMG
jgi:histidyl-tRNA synthetase